MINNNSDKTKIKSDKFNLLMEYIFRPIHQSRSEHEICTCCKRQRQQKRRNSRNAHRREYDPGSLIANFLRIRLIAFFSPINTIGVCIFSFCCILQIAEGSWNEWSLVEQILSNFPFFRTLLAKSECTCTLSAGCPLEHFVFAEFLFCSLITYIWRIFRHWKGLVNQRRYIAAIYPTISKEEKSAIRNRRN